MFLLQDIKVGDIVCFEDGASGSNGLNSGYAMVTAKDATKASEKDLTVRAINTKTEGQVEPAWVQNIILQNFLSHITNVIWLLITKFEGEYKTVYVKLKYILEKEDEEKLQLQINVVF